MAVATTVNTLRMVFRNEEGKNVTISLSDPKENITAAEIETVMDLLIGRNVFTSTGGDIVTKHDIKLVTNTTDDLFD